MPSCSSESSARAFTLIEVLAVVAVVSILLAIALPALRGARSQADVAGSQSKLRQIMLLHGAYSQSHDNKWANLLSPGEEYESVEMGEMGHLFTETLEQVTEWAYCFRPTLLERQEPVDILAAPIVARTSLPTANPQTMARRSYHYSPAFFTQANLWDPAQPDRRLRPDDFRKSVGVHEVSYTDRKVVMFEPRDHHGDGSWLGDPNASSTMRVNVSFADSHVQRVSPRDAEPALAVQWPADYQAIANHPLPTPLPFACSPWGYRGRDF